MDTTMKKKEKKEIPLPPHKYQPPCIKSESHSKKTTPGKTLIYDALPRDCEFAYKTPGYYTTGFGILDVYKTDVDYTDLRRLLFLEDSKQVKKWGDLRSRIPYPEGRVTSLPGTSDVNYKNYCLRSLTPESAASWRKSITRSPLRIKNAIAKENIKAQEFDGINL